MCPAAAAPLLPDRRLTCKDVAALAAGASGRVWAGVRYGKEGARPGPQQRAAGAWSRQQPRAGSEQRRPWGWQPAGVPASSRVVHDVARVAQAPFPPAETWTARKVDTVSHSNSRGGLTGSGGARPHLAPLAACTTTTPRRGFALPLFRRLGEMRPWEESPAKEAICPKPQRPANSDAGVGVRRSGRR